MTGWIVLLLLLAAVLLLGFLRVGAEAGYGQEGPWLTAFLGPIPLVLYPVDREKAAKKAEKKRAKARKKEEAARKKGKAPEEPEKPSPALGGKLSLAWDLLPVVRQAAGRFRRKIRVDDLVMDLTWGEEDPADAAIHYGWAWAASEALLSVLEANFEIKNRDISLHLDYQREEPLLYVRGKLSLTIGQLLRIALPLAWQGGKILWKHRKKNRPAGEAGGEQRKGALRNGKETSCE